MTRRQGDDKLCPGQFAGALALVVLGAVCAGGCDNRADMVDQPRADAYAPSTLFDDGTSARPHVAGTVPRASDPDRPLRTDTAPPQPRVTEALLARGRERFDIYCSMCHGRDGYGNGMVVRRGYPQAASYHTDRLRSVPDQYIYDVITNGHKNMPAYGFKVPPRDRWAIIAYVRALQLSQHARFNELPTAAQRKITNSSAGDQG